MKAKIIDLLRKPLTSILLSIIIGLIVGAIMLLLAGFNPIEAYSALLNGIFSKPRYMVQVIIVSTPLILTGLSISFAFKTGLFNIGAEGQYMMGAIGAVLAGTQLSLPPVLHFFVTIAFGVSFAAAYGAIAGYLKARFGINEVITGIMLNWIALYFNNYMINLPWLKKPETEASYEIATTARAKFLGEWKTSEAGLAFFKEHPSLSDVILRTDINYGIFIAIAVAVLVWFVLNRTTLGFKLRAVGFNRDGAEFSGININKSTITAMAVSGGLAGLAGALSITCTQPHRITMLAAQEGFGFDGISVALIASSNPLGCILSALLFGGLKYGSSSIQLHTGAPSEVIDLIIGTIVFSIAISTIFPMIADYFAKKEESSHGK